MASILTTAADWSARLRSEAEASAALQALVERAELHQDGIRLSVRLPILAAVKEQASIPAHLIITRSYRYA